jgi:hypothetical protein
LTPAHLAGKITAMNTRIFSALIALVAITSVVSITFAQSPAPQPGAPSTTVTTPAVSAPATTAAAPDPAEMMKQMMEMAKLNENHKVLADLAGSWSYTVKMMAPGEPPSTSAGSLTRKPVMNGRFFVGEYTGTMLEGYDNVKQKFVSSWVDNMGTGIMNSEGSYDPATKTFTYSGEVEPVPGMKMPVHEVIKVTDKNHHTFEWYENRGGQETKTLEINYTRKK